MTKNLYAILGVDAQAEAPQIRAAFEALMAKAAPDDDIRRLALKEAWSTLGHPQRRAAYDATLRQAPRRSATASIERDDAGSRPRLLPLVVVAALLVGGGWWAWRHQAHKQTTVRVVAAPRPDSTLFNNPAPAAAATGPGTVPTAAPTPSNGAALTPEALFARASSSVVRINMLNANGEGVSLGSGVVVARGSVVTNCHVTRSGQRIKVKHQSEVHDAQVTISDEAHDLCMLSVPTLGAAPIGIGNSAGLKVGQKVYAIGSPQGLDLSLSDGLVSALRQGPDGNFIQTTAPVSPGSSGGGLFAEDGQLVGIVTFQMRAGQNLNFAVPVEWISRMSNTRQAESSGTSNVGSAAQAPQPARDDTMTSALLGTWHCFGALTGRGLDFVFEADGRLGGQVDGRPINGRYSIQNRQLLLTGVDINAFGIEELTPTRMVLSVGQGRRLACNR